MKSHKISGPAKGFTVIEIAIVIGILAIIFAVGTPVALDFYYNYQLNSERDNFITILKQARNLSLANQGETDHGVYINTDKFVLFYGPSFAGRDQSKDLNFVYSAAVIVAASSPEILFAGLSARSASTTVSFNYGAQTNYVYVNQEGNIDW